MIGIVERGKGVDLMKVIKKMGIDWLNGANFEVCSRFENSS